MSLCEIVISTTSLTHQIRCGPAAASSPRGDRGSQAETRCSACSARGKSSLPAYLVEPTEARRSWRRRRGVPLQAMPQLTGHSVHARLHHRDFERRSSDRAWHWATRPYQCTATQNVGIAESRYPPPHAVENNGSRLTPCPESKYSAGTHGGPAYPSG